MSQRNIFDTILINIKKILIIITTLGNIGYLTLLLALNVGNEIFNYCILGLTIAYFLFFLCISLTLTSGKSKLNKTIRKIYSYTKKSIRLVNAIFVIVSLININIGSAHTLTIIGAIFAVITFISSIIIDIIILYIKRKIVKFREQLTTTAVNRKNAVINAAMPLIERFIKKRQSSQQQITAAQTQDEVLAVDTPQGEVLMPDTIEMPAQTDNRLDSLIAKLKEGKF